MVTNMADPAVVVDTNIFMYAVVTVPMPGSNYTIKYDEFHYQSVRFLDLLAERHVGYVTETVEEEIFYTVRKAVEDLYARYLKKADMPDSDYVEGIVVGLHEPLWKMVKSLCLVSLDKSLVDANLRRVEIMSKFLIQKYNDWELKHGRKFDEWELIYNGAVVGAGSKGPQGVIAESRKIVQEMSQLHTFQDRDNTKDEKILADTITLKIMRKKPGKPCDCMIASYDSGFFSPRRIHDVVSDTVTREIFKRFGILCNSPAEISPKLANNAPGSTTSGSTTNKNQSTAKSP